MSSPQQRENAHKAGSPHPESPHRLHLVPPRLQAAPAPSADAPSLLALWHLLSLDAPLVAALWTAFIARCAGVSLPWTAPAAMFVAVWMLYAADRLLDARPADSGAAASQLEERHRFHHRHRRSFLAAFIACSVMLAALLHAMAPAALHLYALLAAPLAGYLLLIHAGAVERADRLPKELAVGIFFPAAVCIPTVARAPSVRLELLAPALLFAAVCTLNCLYVYAWEHPRDRSGAHLTTRWATDRLPMLCTVLLLLTSACAVLLLLSPSAGSLATLPAACAMSIGLLRVLDLRRRQLQPVHLRALADAALLTPLVLLPFTYLR